MENNYGSIKIQKEWMSAKDNRVRDSHAQLNGVRVRYNKTFPNGCRYPGDPSGRPEKVYNCRCTMVAITPNASQKKRTGNTVDSYKKWKQEKRKPIPKTINFETGDDANNYFSKKETYKTWSKNLTDESRDVIKEYTYTDYQDINYRLRKAGVKDENVLLDERLHGDKRKNQIDCLDKIISSFELEDNIIVYRNVESQLFADYFDDLNRLVGQRISEKGFTSTVCVESGASADWEKDCKIKLKVPAGKGRGAYINDYSTYENNEYEFLIARDSTFKVIKVDETEDNLILEMEMIV